MTEGYIDFAVFLVATDILMLMDVLIYAMYVVVMMNVILAWLPDIFGSLLVLFGKYASKHVVLLIAISVILLIIASYVRMALLGPLVFGMSDLYYALTRNLMMFTNGYFLESGVSTFGISESLSSAEESDSVLALTMQSVAMTLVFQFVIFNVFVALTLFYLRESREGFKARQEVLTK